MTLFVALSFYIRAQWRHHVLLRGVPRWSWALAVDFLAGAAINNAVWILIERAVSCWDLQLQLLSQTAVELSKI